MVEFAFVAPLGFLLLLSIIVTAIIVTNFIQVTNIARDGARVAAICGSVPGTPMPDGSGPCTGAAIFDLHHAALARHSERVGHTGDPCLYTEPGRLWHVQQHVVVWRASDARVRTRDALTGRASPFGAR